MTSKNTVKRVVFRTDGNSQIGMGHLTRCLALADMLKADFTCHFTTQNPSEPVINQILQNGFSYTPLPETTDYLLDAQALLKDLVPGNMVVLDGYFFDTKYQQIIRQNRHKVVCIDDIHAFPFIADVVINQAGGLNNQQYQTAPYTRLCLGPDYALLRNIFLAAGKQDRVVTDINHIFLNMGGADPTNQTCLILEKLLPHIDNKKIDVVIGAAYQHLSELQSLIRGTESIEIFQQLDANEMCRLMQQCDVAILPPSSVAYEWCCVKGPLFLHQTAGNQTNLARFLRQAGLAFDFEDFAPIVDKPDSEKIKQQQLNQKEYFNGQSPVKLRNIFFGLLFADALTLRPVTVADLFLLFNWANDPEVRQNSFTTAPIPLEVHKIWFENKLNSGNCMFYIAEIEGIPAGMLRFDIQQEEAIISYLLDKDYRGMGLAPLLLQKSLKFLSLQKPDVKSIIGHVQQNNQASIKAFVKNGFTESPSITPKMPGSLVFEKRLK